MEMWEVLQPVNGKERESQPSLTFETRGQIQAASWETISDKLQSFTNETHTRQDKLEIDLNGKGKTIPNADKLSREVFAGRVERMTEWINKLYNPGFEVKSQKN